MTACSLSRRCDLWPQDHHARDGFDRRPTATQTSTIGTARYKRRSILNTSPVKWINNSTCPAAVGHWLRWRALVGISDSQPRCQKGQPVPIETSQWATDVSCQLSWRYRTSGYTNHEIWSFLKGWRSGLICSDMGWSPITKDQIRLTWLQKITLHTYITDLLSASFRDVQPLNTLSLIKMTKKYALIPSCRTRVKINVRSLKIPQLVMK